MGEHMLIKIADGQERFLAQNTSGDVCLAVLETFMACEFASTTILFFTNLTFKTFFMQHQMVVQPTSMVELFTAQVTWIFILDLTISFLMPPFVAFDVFDFLAAKATDL